MKVAVTMAHRRDRPAPEPELREALAAHYREEAASTPERTDAGRGDGTFFLAPWRRLAERLDAGEALDVGGWELKKWRPDLDAQARYRLHEDGTVTELRRRSQVVCSAGELAVPSAENVTVGAGVKQRSQRVLPPSVTARRRASKRQRRPGAIPSRSSQGGQRFNRQLCDGASLSKASSKWCTADAAPRRRVSSLRINGDGAWCRHAPA